MKRKRKYSRFIFLMLFLLFIFENSSVLAQEDNENHLKPIAKLIPKKKLNIIKTNPLSMIWGQIPFTGEFRLMYEGVIAPQQTTTVGISYNTASIFILEELERQGDSLGYSLGVWGFRVQAAHKFYLQNNELAPKGMYVGIHSSFNTAKIYIKDIRDIYLQANFFNINAISGYQFIWDRIVLDTNIGLGYRHNFLIERFLNLQAISPLDMPTPDGWHPNFKFSLTVNAGWLF